MSPKRNGAVFEIGGTRTTHAASLHNMASPETKNEQRRRRVFARRTADATWWFLPLALGACGSLNPAGSDTELLPPGALASGSSSAAATLTGAAAGTGAPSATTTTSGTPSGGIEPVGSATGSAPAPVASTPEPIDCDQPKASVVPLAPLTESQYNNSLADFFGISGDPAKGLGESFDDVSLEQRAHVAEAVAAEAVSNLTRWAPCTPPANGDATNCELQLIDEVGAKLYRRPLSDVERSDMKKLFDAGVEEKDFATGVEWFLTGILQSPYFVYQVVRPDAAEVPGEVRPLTAYEYASRLAYFIWDGPPDDTLTAAAASGDLADPVKRAQQVARLMQDDRALRGIKQFYSSWLKLNSFREVSRDVENFDDDVVAALTESLLLSATELYKSSTPNIASLFTGDTYYFNDVLGSFYDVAVTGSEFQPRSLAGQARRGILTHPALMALLSRPDESFPIGRGLYVLHNVVCKVIPALPPGFVPPQQPAQQEGVSTRKRLEVHTADPTCQVCHSMINAAGFVFENFDEVGRYRATDHGVAVDSSVVLALGMDVDGTYATGDEVIAKFADSSAVRECFAERYVDFALSHDVTDPADACSIQAVSESFKTSGDLKKLVETVAASDSFRMRLAQGVGQ